MLLYKQNKARSQSAPGFVLIPFGRRIVGIRSSCRLPIMKCLINQRGNGVLRLSGHAKEPKDGLQQPAIEQAH